MPANRHFVEYSMDSGCISYGFFSPFMINSIVSSDEIFFSFWKIAFFYISHASKHFPVYK